MMLISLNHCAFVELANYCNVDSFKELDEEIGRKPVDKEGQGLAEQNMYQVQNSIHHDMI